MIAATIASITPLKLMTPPMNPSTAPDQKEHSDQYVEYR